MEKTHAGRSCPQAPYGSEGRGIRQVVYHGNERGQARIAALTSTEALARASRRAALSGQPAPLYWTFSPNVKRFGWEIKPMGMQCDVCGKKPVKGNQYVRSGKAKYLGGVGRKVRGISRRTFRPNLQHIQCQVGGSVQRMRVCVQCIRSGKVQRPQRRKPFQMPSL
jgi:large subunit ribosomal protein L28